MARVVFFDEHAAWSPSINAVSLHGGGEIHEVQICEGFAKRGHEVWAFAHGGRGQVENGVQYLESRGLCEAGARIPAMHADVLIVQTSSRIPPFVLAGRTFTHQIHDPRPCEWRWDHLNPRADVVHVCVSSWLADLYKPRGWKTAVIHPPLDVSTMRDRPRNPNRFVTCASWNKGTDLALRMWKEIRPELGPQAELLVTSPYSEPEDAGARCEAHGAHWIGRSPAHCIPEFIASAGAGLFLCNVHPETFGITVAFARLLGVPVYIYCEREMGALGEAAGANEYVFERDAKGFKAAVIAGLQPVRDGQPFPAPDLSERHVMDAWCRLGGIA